MIRPVSNNRGMALLLTVLVISLLLVMIMEFNRAMRSNLQSAANLRDGVKLVYMARSAFDTARALLFVDGLESNHDSLQEKWANLELFSLYGSRFFEKGNLMVAVEDLSGRLQVNALLQENGDFNADQRGLWEDFLLLPEYGLDRGRVDEILEALKDWLDEDNSPGLTAGGAENSYYQSLETPYSCRNGPMDSVQELLLVKGIDRDLLYGNGEHPGILEYVTARGKGQININTADPMVIKALSDGITQDMIDELVAYRQDENNNLADKNWAGTILAGANVKMDLLTTSSSYFSIRATANAGMVSRTINGVVKRTGQGPPEILSWKME